jgi:DNA invertase Pin-like site-specific DNA recombinase
MAVLKLSVLFYSDVRGLIMPKAYAYSRYSNATQGDGDSLRRQLKACFDWATANDLELDTTHRDTGVSGFTGVNRIKGALGSFLAKVETGEIEHGSFLLVDSLDRLSRESETVVLNMLSGLVMAGIKVVNVAENHVLGEGAEMVDYMRVLIHASRSHLESQEKSRKIGEAHEKTKRRAREEGHRWHKSGPRWLTGIVHNKDTKDRYVEFHEIADRVRIVRRIFDLIEAGLGTSAIATRFNEDNEPTPRDGQGWHHSTVLEIAKNRAVLGEYQPKFARRGVRASRRPKDGEAIPNYYPRIIEPDQFHRVQAIIKSRGPRNGRRANLHEFTNLFIGICGCHSCEGTVGIHVATSQSKWKRSAVLKCNNAGRGLCTNKRRYPYAPFEQSVLRHVSEFVIPATRVEDRYAKSISRLTGEREELRLQTANIMNLAQKFGDEDFVMQHRVLKAQLGEIDKELDRLRAEQKEVGAGVTVKARQEALQALIVQLTSVEGDKLYSLRAAISAALRGVVEKIWFDPNNDVTLIMKGRLIAYKFVPDLGIFSRVDLDYVRALMRGEKPDRAYDGFTEDAA